MKMLKENRSSLYKIFLCTVVILVNVSLEAQSKYFLIEVNDTACFIKDCNKVVNYNKIINPLLVRNIFFYDNFLVNSKDMPKTIKLFDSVCLYTYLDNILIFSRAEIIFPDSLNKLKNLYSIHMKANLTDSTFSKSIYLPSLERLNFGSVNLKDTSGFEKKFPNLRVLNFHNDSNSNIVLTRNFLEKLSNMKKLEIVYISVPDNWSNHKKRTILKWSRKLKRLGVEIEID